MTKEELRTKITGIMDEAIKIDTMENIVKDMERTMRRDDLSDMARDALMIGYGNMLHKAYSKIRFIWLHLHELRDDLNGVYVTDNFTAVPIEDQPTEEEIARVREENGDD